MAAVPARQPKQAKAAAPRRNVLRKAADADVHPAEPRTAGASSSSRGRSTGAGRASSSVPRPAGGRTARD